MHKYIHIQIYMIYGNIPETSNGSPLVSEIVNPKGTPIVHIFPRYHIIMLGPVNKPNISIDPIHKPNISHNYDRSYT